MRTFRHIWFGSFNFALPSGHSTQSSLTTQGHSDRLVFIKLFQHLSVVRFQIIKSLAAEAAHLVQRVHSTSLTDLGG